MLNIVFDTAAAALLVRAEHHADSAIDRETQVTDGLQPENRTDHRPFVIKHTAPVEFSAVDLCAKGWVFPALPRRDDIQVAQHADHFRTAAVLDPPYTVVNMAGAEAELFSKGERVIQRGTRSLSIRGAGFRRSTDAVNPYGLLYGLDDRIRYPKNVLI